MCSVINCRSLVKQAERQLFSFLSLLFTSKQADFGLNANFNPRKGGFRAEGGRTATTVHINPEAALQQSLVHSSPQPALALTDVTLDRFSRTHQVTLR